jgi:hypothetical protein
MRAVEYFGGSPAAFVSDNLKSAVTKARRQEPDLGWPASSGEQAGKRQFRSVAEVSVWLQVDTTSVPLIGPSCGVVFKHKRVRDRTLTVEASQAESQH